ncbi:type II toxin-antitoxin system death-on-curing family toxin [Loktanella sp. M215]|uniref:type II toxin-antitoxin system death-on-curing family toxin n=1 Tax=Loktanella sp. M215 TaxID=2675431 RepID=UPI001F022831|nr:type II toxin-antitoxin system death-on-curing family toxin [Loktanella sp. M215]MCF7697968.1 type II toxin-antitoxin system death-on-curing family toxin [Loktanella sp. M215]
MTFQLLTVALVDVIHDSVLNPGELQGRAKDKSLDGALSRVENRLAYGMIVDVFDLAAAYATAVAQGHCFNDGNKRTAHQVMDVCLDLNGIEIDWQPTDIGDQIIRLAQGHLTEDDFATWLRQQV